MFWFLVAKLYSSIYGFFIGKLNISLRGLGYILRKLNRDHIIEVDGKKLFLNHKVASCYERLINGVYNEPETHLFLKALIDKIDSSVTFVDVGANVGEMIVDIARYDKVEHVVGFEPHPECAAACRKSIKLNRFENVILIQKVLSDSRKYVSFEFDSVSPNASKITEKKDSMIEASTLDDELGVFHGNCIILIDVEGAELKVVKGGKSFIQKRRPLIVFEFNQVTKQHFRIDEMKDELGKDYRIYRLRRDDGRLDDKINDAWNCVAVHISSPFFGACSGLMHGSTA